MSIFSTPHFQRELFSSSSVQNSLAKLEECLFGFMKVGPKFVRGASEIIASGGGRRGIGRISDVSGGLAAALMLGALLALILRLAGSGRLVSLEPDRRWHRRSNHPQYFVSHSRRGP